MRAVRSAVLILFAVIPPVLATACGGGETTVTPPPPVSVASVSLSQSAATLTPPQTVALVATTKDASGNTLTGHTITWTSTATAVVTVDATGLVTAVAVGSAQITATVETKSASATITVNPGTFLGPSGGTATGFNGSATVTIPAGALGVGVVITIAQVANPQADPKLAAGTGYDFGPTGTAFALPVTLSIKYDPTLLAGGTNQAQLRVHKLVGSTWTPLAGSTVNTSTHVVSGATSSFSTYAVLEVTVPVASVAISPSPVDLPQGMQVQLTATTKDSQGNVIPGRTVTWQSSVTNTAAISTTGLVTAGVIGATTITATSEGISSQMTLNVRSDPSARTLSLDQGSGYVYVPNRGIVVIPGTSDATCAIGSDQRGYCWGHNALGAVGDGTFVDRAVPTAVALSAPLVDITAGGGFACALDTSNNAWCWGNNWGLYGNGSITSGGPTPVAAAGGRKFVDLSAGESHVCGIGTDTFTYCWGQNSWGSLGIGFISNATAITTPTRISGDPILVSLSVGNYGACGLTIAGAAYCWGSTGVHVGSSPGPQLSATAVPGAPAFARISVGFDHVCGLTMDRKLYCWGQNDLGQLGDGTTADRPTPLLVGGGMSWRFVSAGWSYTCGITTDNRTFCWGLGGAGGFAGEGQVGSGTANGSLLPVQVSGGVPALAVVSAGIDHTCGLTVDGTGYCWGFRGDLGDGDYSYSFRPTLVAGAQNARDVARGSPLGCYINTTNQLMCWGESEAETSAQVPSFGAVAVKSMVASDVFACVILDLNSHISCWGDNYLGNLGNGTTVSATAPTPIASAKAFSSVALAWYGGGGCGVSTAKELLCWGNGSLTPVQVLPGINWVSVWGGEDAYICAISDQAQAYCGPLPSSLTLIAGSQHWVMMATGQSSSRCGLTDTGDAYCMGDNSVGQLGDGTTTARAAMVPVSGGLKFTQIITARGTTCGMTAVGAAYCWGDGSDGQMGSAPGVPLLSGPFTPTLIPGGLHFTKLAGGTDGICGVTSDGSVYCWGTRNNSSLGNGELDDRRTPVPVSGSMRFLLYEPGTAGLSARRAKQP